MQASVEASISQAMSTLSSIQSTTKIMLSETCQASFDVQEQRDILRRLIEESSRIRYLEIHRSAFSG